MTVVLKDVSLLELMSHMPTCRKCNQTYHQSHFISGNGPRYLICGRCAVEDGLVSPEEAPQYYSDELARAVWYCIARGTGLWHSRVQVGYCSSQWEGVSSFGLEFSSVHCWWPL